MPALPTSTRRRLTRVAESGARRVLPPPDPAGRRVVLCYHSVDPRPNYLGLTPDLFDAHLAWLEEHCQVVSLDELVAEPRRSGGPYVAITFDDGYADNHEFALPLLVDHGIEATFFLTAGLVDQDRPTLERFKYLRNVDEEMIRPLQWTQVAEMLQAGMQIGAHSYTHPNLAGLDGSELAYEVAHSKRIVEDRIGHDISTMAYPFGRPKVHVTQPVLEAVGRAGFGFACTTVTRGVQARDQPLGIPRFIATQNPVEVLREKVLGTWDLVGTLRERAPLKIARMVSPIDFEF